MLLEIITSLALFCLSDFKVLLYPKQYFPDFPTSCNRELILSADFFAFLLLSHCQTRPPAQNPSQAASSFKKSHIYTPLPKKTPKKLGFGKTGLYLKYHKGYMFSPSFQMKGFSHRFKSLTAVTHK